MAPAQAPAAMRRAAPAAAQPMYGFMEAAPADPMPTAMQQVATASEQQPIMTEAAWGENQAMQTEAQPTEAERAMTVDAQRQAVQELGQILNENRQAIEEIQVAQADPNTHGNAMMNG